MWFQVLYHVFTGCRHNATSTVMQFRCYLRETQYGGQQTGRHIEPPGRHLEFLIDCDEVTARSILPDGKPRKHGNSI